MRRAARRAVASPWDGLPPEPHRPGRHPVQRILPEPRPAQDWEWLAAEGCWRNAIGGRVPPALLADGRFRLAPAAPPAPRQLALF